VCNAKRF